MENPKLWGFPGVTAVHGVLRRESLRRWPLGTEWAGTAALPHGAESWGGAPCVSASVANTRTSEHSRTEACRRRSAQRGRDDMLRLTWDPLEMCMESKCKGISTDGTKKGAQ